MHLLNTWKSLNMKATLKFNLDDPDDNMAHTRCVKALSMALAIFEITNVLRGANKYTDAHEKITQDIYDVLQQNGINIDELIN